MVPFLAEQISFHRKWQWLIIEKCKKHQQLVKSSDLEFLKLACQRLRSVCVSLAMALFHSKIHNQALANAAGSFHKPAFRTSYLSTSVTGCSFIEFDDVFTSPPAGRERPSFLWSNKGLDNYSEPLARSTWTLKFLQAIRDPNLTGYQRSENRGTKHFLIGKLCNCLKHCSKETQHRSVWVVHIWVSQLRHVSISTARFHVHRWHQSPSSLILHPLFDDLLKLKKGCFGFEVRPSNLCFWHLLTKEVMNCPNKSVEWVKCLILDTNGGHSIVIPVGSPRHSSFIQADRPSGPGLEKRSMTNTFKENGLGKSPD